MRIARIDKSVARTNRAASARSVGRHSQPIPSMNKTILFSSLALGLALVGCSKSARTDSATVAANPAPATNTADALTRNAGNALNSVASSAHQVEWKLNGDDIKDDIAAGRTIERSKAGAPTGNVKVDRSELKKAVEARFLADSDIANVPISIDADRDGQINLSGKANTVEQVGRAIAVALDTDNVTKVVSKIKLDKEGNAHR